MSITTLLLIFLAFILGMVVMVAAAGPISRMLQPKQPKSAVARWNTYVNMLRLVGLGGMKEDDQSWYMGLVTCLTGDRLGNKQLDKLNTADISWIIQTMQETLTVCQRIPTNAETVRAAIKRIADAQAQK